jgi:hypothetical protein
VRIRHRTKSQPATALGASTSVHSKARRLKDDSDPRCLLAPKETPVEVPPRILCKRCVRHERGYNTPDTSFRRRFLRSERPSLAYHTRYDVRVVIRRLTGLTMSIIVIYQQLSLSSASMKALHRSDSNRESPARMSLTAAHNSAHS